MRVYRVDFHDASEGAIVEWCADLQDATRALRKLQADRDEPQGVERVTPVEIPTSKAGLLNWLNQHFTSDNG